MVETTEKITELFDGSGKIIDKSLANLSDQFRKLPRFVADYLISSYVDGDDPGPGLAKIDRLIKEHFVESDQKEWVKSQIKQNGSYHLLGSLRCRYDQAKDEYWADVPCLGDQFVRISPYVIAQYGDTLLTVGAWGTIQIAFDPSYKLRSRLYPFVVVSFTPFQITNINIDEWVQKRNDFENNEWIDLLISSIGFDPDRLDTATKMLYFARLIPFVEPNVNMVELGPPETGKTFNYRSLSSYGFVVSGAKSTIASLFYNKVRRRLGAIGYRDCVMFDEIGHANWNGQDDLVSMMKDFMNTGRFGRDTAEFASECSIVFAGNIDCNRQTKSVKGYYSHLFTPLPQLVNNDRAFLDRIHGYIPGWKIPQIAETNFAKGLGFMADYLSEIFHRMRSRNYSHIIIDQVDFKNMTQRNQVAITRIASGFLKLMFPHRTAETIKNNEVKTVVNLAIDLRKRVVDQLAIIAPAEFAGVKFDYEIKE